MILIVWFCFPEVLIKESHDKLLKCWVCFLAGQCAQGHRETFKGALKVGSRTSWLCCKRRIIPFQKGVCENYQSIHHTFDIDLHLHVVTYRAGLRLLRELLWQLSAQTSMVLVPAEAWSKNGSVISVLRFLRWGVKKENAISLLRERAEESWQDWNSWNSRQFSFFVAVGCVVLSFPALEFQKRHQETWSDMKNT